MLVKDIMTDRAEFLAPQANLIEAAKKMQELDCGFIPVSNQSGEKLQGVVTDRDIIVRCLARGCDPQSTPVTEAMSDRVLYCCEGDNLEDAAASMCNQQVYRLIVLNNRDDKQLRGVISLGDILRHNQQHMAGVIAHEITSRAA